ncbi:hypothetical protein [Geminicoccus roseus]|uniref:hypothetical protein n=1 Tax=Geminicoccus roseus TaxID=404900 RepID=UPI000687B568|nr:hypothetical protein [Geminicoccus roseus]
MCGDIKLLRVSEPTSIVSARRPVGVRAHGQAARFALLTSLALLATHAVAFFLHEYSHAVAAWLLGFKSDPLALDYGHLNLANLLLQQEISENVDYDRMFATGHGFEAAVVALAGPGLGNGLLYLTCALTLRRQSSSMPPLGLLLLFWLAVMASGNLWSYAPVRTIATHGDMGIAAQGLGISPWALFPFVVLPSLLAAWDLFSRVLPLVLDRACGADPRQRAFMTATACFIFFGFFGCPSIGGDYGVVSAVISIASMFMLFPLAVMMTLEVRPDIRTGG